MIKTSATTIMQTEPQNHTMEASFESSKQTTPTFTSTSPQSSSSFHDRKAKRPSKDRQGALSTSFDTATPSTTTTMSINLSPAAITSHEKEEVHISDDKMIEPAVTTATTAHTNLVSSSSESDSAAPAAPAAPAFPISTSTPQTPVNHLPRTLDDDESKPPHFHNHPCGGGSNSNSNSNSSKSSVLRRKKLKRIKVTILNLTGIKVSTVESRSCSSSFSSHGRRHTHHHHHLRHHTHQSSYPYRNTKNHTHTNNRTQNNNNNSNHHHHKNKHHGIIISSTSLKDQLQQNIVSKNNNNNNNNNMHKFAITASVSFTGSCNPSDMRIVSGGFCSLSQRLVVESIPVVVPNGMCDSLIAIWDDDHTPTTICGGEGILCRSSSGGGSSSLSMSTSNNESMLRKNNGKNKNEKEEEENSMSQKSQEEVLFSSGCNARKKDKSNANSINHAFGKEKGKIQISDKSTTLPHLFVSMIDDGDYNFEDQNDDYYLQHELGGKQSVIQAQHQHQDIQNTQSDMATVESKNMRSRHSLLMQQHPSMTLSALSSSVHYSLSPDLDETDASSSEKISPAIIREIDHSMIFGETTTDMVNPSTGSRTNSNHKSTTFLRSSTLSPFQSLTNIREESATATSAANDNQSTKPLRASTIVPPPFHTPTRDRTLNSSSNLHQEILPDESPTTLPVQKNEKCQGTLKRGANPPIKEVYEAKKSGYDIQDSLSYNPIVNTPSQSLFEAVPEILEFNIALRIHQIPSNTGTDDPYSYHNEGGLNNVQSLCSLDANGGGAVAHLVLFPDVLHRDEKLPNGNTGRILELPVRRKNLQIYRSTASSVSGLTTHCSSYYEYRRYCNEPEIFVDIEEDAIIRVKIEECTDEDIEALDNEQKLVTNTSCAVDISLIDDMEEDEEVSKKKKKDDGDNNKNNGNNCLDKDGEKHTQSSEQSDSASHEPQADSSVEKDTEGDSPKNSTNKNNNNNDAKSKKSSPQCQSRKNPEDPDISVNKSNLCNPFRIESLVRVFSGIVANCSDDVDLYRNIGDALSMDSTIYTMEYQR